MSRTALKLENFSPVCGKRCGRWELKYTQEGFCMKEKYQQIMGAFLLGIVVPGVAFGFGGWRVAEKLPRSALPALSSASEQETAVPTEPEKDQPLTLNVLMPDGQLKEMDTEEYVIGVVLAEMPTSFAPDALKAQAVVARTYALKRGQEGIRHSEGAVCTDPGCCQAYLSTEEYLDGLGYMEDVEKVKAAVADTAGEVLTYSGKLIEATYFSCSGGKTEDAAAVWGQDYPYLQTVESPGEENVSEYREERQFSAAEFSKALGRKLEGDPDEWLGWTTYTKGGGVDTMVICGKTYEGTQLRQLLGLNSTAFFMHAEGGRIYVATYGKGHRVGMSQCGAGAMAASGKNYREILAHYYLGAELTTMTQPQ